MLIERFRDAELWAQALDRYSKQSFEQAIAKLNAITGPRRLASEYFALLGSAHLASGGPTARTLLSAAMTSSVPTRAGYRNYVDAYCGYYLAILDGNDGRAVKLLEQALRMDAPAIIRRWLPLS